MVAALKHMRAAERGKVTDKAGVPVDNYCDSDRAALDAWLHGEAPANVWIGTSVEDQRRADERIPELLSIPARVRFLSMEPLLGPVDLRFIPPINKNAPCSIDSLTGEVAWPDNDYNSGPKIDWVIVGGESGPGARPMGRAKGGPSQRGRGASQRGRGPSQRGRGVVY
jgi:hypothetical protein